jgi:hypothetical protein
MTPEQQKLLEELLALDNQGDAAQEPTKAELIIEAFAAMNSTALEILLDDTKTYQDASKELFLERLEELFQAHKNSGDDYLFSYPGKCCADASRCDNCGKTGYRFVGNQSNNYSDFIFEIGRETVSDIYDCSRFEITETIENLETKASLDFDEDEKASFVKTPEYLIKVTAAEEAFSEISTTPPQLLDFEQLSYWVDKYAVLSERIGEYDFFEPIMKWTPFTHLYYNLKRITNYFNTNLKLIQLANEQYKTLQTEQDYIDWIVKYYDIFDKTPYEFRSSTTIDKGFVYFSFYNKTKILLHGQECMEAYHFFKNYETKNAELLKKYCVYNDAEYREKYNDDSFEEDLSNLKYHLQQREALSKIGIEIPFYIIKCRF